MVLIKFLKQHGEMKPGEEIETKEGSNLIEMEKEGIIEIIRPKKENLEAMKSYFKSQGKETEIKEDSILIINKEKKEEELLNLLKRKNIFNEITEIELDKKIVKEIETRKTIFLCACGRLVEDCQIASYNLLVNDEAGTGKDYVTSKTLEIFPREQVEKRTRISNTVFTYWHRWDKDWTWDGKVCYLEDISDSVINSEVFKVMCSSGSKATVVIKQNAVDIDIEGKPVIIITSANAIPNPELTRRFEFVQLDESINQTKEIKKRHAEYAVKGLSPEYDSKYTNALRLLKRVKVKIPYAKKLPNLFPDGNVVMRTKFPRFLDLIKASAAFHQYQRKTDKEGYIVANSQDYALATEIMTKLISNQFMISLTKNQLKIVDFFKKSPDFCENVAKINEKMRNFISIPALKTNLSILTKWGILDSLVSQDSLNRDIEKFKLSENIDADIKFPSYKKLVSKDSKVIKDSIDSKDSKVLEMEVKNP